jgi:type VII secretion protein EccB
MAARRDELNAYTFARKRTVAAFLKPQQNGSAEDAPRPMKAFMPSLVVGALILVGFGGYGMIKPSAPTGWDTPGANVLVGSKSTTRYVYLDSGKKDKAGKEIDLLHPVLNLASARLLLSPDKYQVLKVDESVLDNPKILHGPTIGIPYAPDRLPEKDEAAKPKVWALCEQPIGTGTGSGTGTGGDTAKTEKMVFVLGGEDKKDVEESKNQLKPNEGLFVEAPGGGWYLVDNQGKAYAIGAIPGTDANGDPVPLTSDEQAVRIKLSQALFGASPTPQAVTSDFMATLKQGAPIAFPQLDGVGTPSSAAGVPAQHNTIGMVIRVVTGDHPQLFVVLKDRLAPITDFTSRLLLQGPDATTVYGNAKAEPLRDNLADIEIGARYDDKKWPAAGPTQVNTPDGRKVSCSVFHGTADSAGNAVQSTWAATKYPEEVSEGGTSAYVTPGSGLLLRRVSSLNNTIGSVFLVTDTGLRYSVPSNGDSDTTAADTASADPNQSADDGPQKRLGYDGVTPVSVPNAWIDLLAAGPTLDTTSAKQPQNQ